MSQYEKIALSIRKKVSKLTLEQQRQIAKIYEEAIENLSSKAAKAKDKSLTKRWLNDYIKALKRARSRLIDEVRKQTIHAVELAAELGIEPEQIIMTEIFKLAQIDPGDHFSTMFSRAQEDIVKDIITGNLYKDNKTLSSRIWNYGREFEKDIQYIINQAMLEKKSAIELARDLEKYVKEPARRPSNWGKAYPNLKSKKADYNAIRLARTSINHAYQTASIKSSSMNPFVEGIEWRSALIHGRTCELCMDRHGKIYPIDDVPLDHPNGLCTMIPYIPKSTMEVATELRDWIDGKDNPKLDKWYNEHGEYFAFKKL